MEKAVESYGRTKREGLPQRELEGQALIAAAARLQKAADSEVIDEIRDAIEHNRRLWTVFGARIEEVETPLPTAVRENVRALANFILNHSIRILRQASSEDIAVLIMINRNIASGLMTPVPK